MTDVNEIRGYLKELRDDIIPEIEKGHYKTGGEKMLDRAEKIQPLLSMDIEGGAGFHVSFLYNSLKLCGSYCSREKNPEPEYVEGHLKTVISQLDLAERELYDF